MITECVPHHYRLEEANGPTVLGTCKKCGHEREYKSFLDWDALPKGGDRMSGMFVKDSRLKDSVYISDLTREKWQW